MTKIPRWWPDHSPIYDIEKSYLENAEQGPFFDGVFVPRSLPDERDWVNFLGFRVASALGVPAGPLLNARWVSFAARMGFDIVTYKTIRSREYPAHPVPNMIYVDTQGMLSHQRAQEVLRQSAMPPRDLSALAVTNSFGIPSRDPSFLEKDIAAAQASLSQGQVMIVSIVGTPRPGEDFVKDFVTAAEVALSGGAQIVEADLSCPNVASREGSLFTDVCMVGDITARLKKALNKVPLILKIGVIEQEERLRQVMGAAARAGADALCGINTMSMRVVKPSGEGAALGENRLQAGVCGSPIREVALDFVRKAYKINQQDKLDLVLMGTGGVTLPEHFDLFFEAGAEVAMSAVGMMWDPYLAARYHELKVKK